MRTGQTHCRAPIAADSGARVAGLGSEEVQSRWRREGWGAWQPPSTVQWMCFSARPAQGDCLRGTPGSHTRGLQDPIPEAQIHRHSTCCPGLWLLCPLSSSHGLHWSLTLPSPPCPRAFAPILASVSASFPYLGNPHSRPLSPRTAGL